MRKYREYTDEDILNKVKEVKSLAELLRAFNLKVVGGNYVNMKKNLQRLKADCSHWTGSAWSKGEQLKDFSSYTRVGNFKHHLLKTRGNQCECCKNTEWLNQIIKLEVHHIDGHKGNNKEENLQLLCPNCHAYTPNYRKPKF